MRAILLDLDSKLNFRDNLKKSHSQLCGAVYRSGGIKMDTHTNDKTSFPRQCRSVAEAGEMDGVKGSRGKCN